MAGIQHALSSPLTLFQSRYLLLAILLSFNVNPSESQDFISYVRNRGQPQVETSDYTDYVPSPYYIPQEEPLSRIAKRSEVQTRIKGGRTAQKGEKPFQIWLGLNQKYRCGAALIDASTIQVALTAAHCVWNGPGRTDPISTKGLIVVAGDWKLGEDESTEVVKIVKKVVIHPSYDHETTDNDIAILFFDGNEFPQTGDIDTIALPQYNSKIPPKVEVSGWGSERAGGPNLKLLRVAEIKTTPSNDCGKITVTDMQYCVETDGVSSTCGGDSGSPAVAKDPASGNILLYGLVSYRIGTECGIVDFPSVHVRVSQYVDWIRTTASDYKSG